MLTRLSAGIKDKKLSPCDRAGLVSDSYALVKAGHMQPEELITLLANYDDEDTLVAWDAVTSALVGLDAVLSDDEKMNANFQVFAKKLLSKIAAKVGWDFGSSDAHQTSLLRSIIVSVLGRFSYNDPAIASEATKRFKAFQEDHHDVANLPADIRSTVFKIVLKNGGESEYTSIKAYFTATDDNSERKHVLNTLGSIPDSKLKMACMEWSVSGEIKVRQQRILVCGESRLNLLSQMSLFTLVASRLLLSHGIGPQQRQGRPSDYLAVFQGQFGKDQDNVGQIQPQFDECLHCHVRWSLLLGGNGGRN
jgi:aminopeptidase N